MDYVRACKRTRRAERGNEELRASSSALEAAWNSQRLRSGDFVGAAEEEQSGMQVNQYTPGGVLRQAWLQLGKNRTLREGLDGQARSLDILACVSAAMRLEQVDFARHQLDHIVAERSCPVIAKFYDCTPMRIAFGKLQQQLVPHARFPVKIDQQWKSVTLDVFLSKSPGRQRSTLRYGVMELLAQGVTCHYITKDDMFAGFRLFCRPRILQGATGSCIYSATETENKDWSEPDKQTPKHHSASHVFASPRMKTIV